MSSRESGELRLPADITTGSRSTNAYRDGEGMEAETRPFLWVDWSMYHEA